MTQTPPAYPAPAPVPFPAPGTTRPPVTPAAPHHAVWAKLADDEMRPLLSEFDVPPELQRAAAQLASDVTPEELTALRRYTRSDHRKINQALRADSAAAPEGEPGERAAAVAAAIDRAPRFARPVNVYRSVKLSKKAQDGLLAAAREAQDAGTALQFGGFLSTTLKPSMEGFGAFRLEIRATHGAYLADVSTQAHELEVLLPHNSAFRVLGVKTVAVRTAAGAKQVQVIQLEQIPDAHKRPLPVVRELKGSARVVLAEARAPARGRQGSRFALASLQGVRLVRV